MGLEPPAGTPSEFQLWQTVPDGVDARGEAVADSHANTRSTLEFVSNSIAASPVYRRFFRAFGSPLFVRLSDGVAQLR